MKKIILLLLIISFGACKELNLIEKPKKLVNADNDIIKSNETNVIHKFINADLINLFESDKPFFSGVYNYLIQKSKAPLFIREFKFLSSIFYEHDSIIAEKYKALKENLSKEYIDDELIKGTHIINQLESFRKMITDELHENLNRFIWDYTEYEDFIFTAFKLLSGFLIKNIDNIILADNNLEDQNEIEQINDFLKGLSNKGNISLIKNEINAIKNFLFNYGPKSKKNLEYKIEQRKNQINLENNENDSKFLSVKEFTFNAMEELIKNSKQFMELIRSNNEYTEEDFAYYLKIRTEEFEELFDKIDNFFELILSKNPNLEEIKNARKELITQYQKQLIIKKEGSIQSIDFFNQQIDLYIRMLEKDQSTDILDKIIYKSNLQSKN